MKKNFLKIAAMLIAAMLLVVSCSQEIAPKNDDNGLVEARISVGFGRDLTVDGNTETSGLIYKYTMEHAWTKGDESEIIYGDVKNPTKFESGDTVKYVTPGLWTINVYAYNNENDSKSIFEGTAQAYFSNQKSSVVVYLAPTKNQKHTLDISVTMQNLVGTTPSGVTSGSGRYKLTYTIEGAGTATKVNETDLVGDRNDTTHITTYKLKNNEKVELVSGFYNVTISVYSVTRNESDTADVNTLVGGIRKGFLLSGNDNVSITGHIEPSDYENISIDAFYIDVNTSLTAENNRVNYSKGDGSTEDKAVVKFILTDNTESSYRNNTDIVSYNWYVAANSTTTPTSTTTNTREFEVTFKAPGYKTVTCQTVYKIVNNETDYYFADTQSIQVYVDPEKFGTNSYSDAVKTQQSETN